MTQNPNHRFTKEEMDIVHQTDLPDMLTDLGYRVTIKGRFHSTKEMDSIRIADRKSFYRYSEQIGGDAITFLQHFHCMTFEEAVKYLLAFNGHSRDRPPPAKEHPPVPPLQEHTPEFVLPEPNIDNRRIYAYLLKRGIAKQIIDSFINSGLLYEDAQHHNCIFVGKNSAGVPVYAYKRGTYDKDGSGFKGDVTGSDKSIAFRLPADPTNDSVHVFESPIDLMSYLTLHRKLNSNAIALCCLHDGALDSYLKDNHHIKSIVLCLDSDKWAKQAVSRIKDKYEPLGYEVSSHLPSRGKDWNEFLQLKKHQRDAGPISLRGSHISNLGNKDHRHSEKTR